MPRYCEFIGDGTHSFDEEGYKEKCPHRGFKHCLLHQVPVGEDVDGWKTCCPECNSPIQVTPGIAPRVPVNVKDVAGHTLKNAMKVAADHHGYLLQNIPVEGYALTLSVLAEYRP